MYGRYTQELGVYAKEEAARLRESGQRRSISERSRTLDLLEYEKGRCAKCRSKFHGVNIKSHPSFLCFNVNEHQVLPQHFYLALPQHLRARTPDTNVASPLHFC